MRKLSLDSGAPPWGSPQRRSTGDPCQSMQSYGGASSPGQFARAVSSDGVPGRTPAPRTPTGSPVGRPASGEIQRLAVRIDAEGHGADALVGGRLRALGRLPVVTARACGATGRVQDGGGAGSHGGLRRAKALLRVGPRAETVAIRAVRVRAARRAEAAIALADTGVRRADPSRRARLARVAIGATGALGGAMTAVAVLERSLRGRAIAVAMARLSHGGRANRYPLGYPRRVAMAVRLL